MFPLTPAVRSLLLINVAVWILQHFGADAMENRFALWPLGSVHFEPWQVVTYAFLHDPAGLMHIAANMLGLASLGPGVEQAWGRRRFLTYYFVCVLSAALFQLVATAVGPSGASTLGASGGVMGVVLAFAMLFPRQKLIFVLLPIPIEARRLIPLIIVVELVLGLTGILPGIAHFAHLGGALGGWLMIMAGRRMRSRQVGRDV